MVLWRETVMMESKLREGIESGACHTVGTQQILVK